MTREQRRAMKAAMAAYMQKLFTASVGISSALKIDYDGPRLSRVEVEGRLQRAGFELRWFQDRRSPSGRGWHRVVMVKPEPKTAVEIVALQALLGSDPLREAYCLHRARQVDAGTVSAYWRTRWNVLYRKSETRRVSGLSR